jgi:uncharacterized tellurite resistance protein B-like protein
METTNYNEALLFLLRVIVYADGVFDEDESNAIKEICGIENISEAYYLNFCERVKNMSEKDMYLHGIDHVQLCSQEEQIKVFVWLYKMAEVDGTVHVKEVRFLLYSFRQADIEFEQVEEAARKVPKLMKG